MESSKKGGKWFAVLYKSLEGISAVLMGLLVVIVLYSVFSRYVLNSSIAWAEEMSRFLMITMVCVGTVTAYFNNEHLGLDILVKFLPAQLHRYVDLVRDLLILFITGFMTTGGWRLMLESFDSVSPAMRIRVGYVYIILPVFTAMLCLTTLCRVVRGIHGLARKKEAE